MIKKVEDSYMFIPDNFSNVSNIKQDMSNTLSEKNRNWKNNSWKEQKNRYIFHTWSDKALKGAVVNRALTSLHGMLRALKVPLEINHYYIKGSVTHKGWDCKDDPKL